jgi:hypothetical protein
MKKILMILVAIVCFGVSANAANTLYSVIVTTQINYVYYADDGVTEVGRSTATGAAQSFEICASTPDKARSQAESECSTMCKRDYRKDEGKKTYNGKSYQCYSTREVYGSKVESKNQSC